ncbi:MAG: hypothetical protein HRT88_21940, partial [Lentisphaeraceae bacterium]|nr:hypothetical protein [Lentisphaeraceae bacterium]
MISKYPTCKSSRENPENSTGSRMQYYNSKFVSAEKINSSNSAPRNKVPANTAVNKLLLFFCLIFLATTPAIAQSKESLFDFDAWSKKYGQSTGIDEWMTNNPHPYGKRWNPTISFFQKRYTTTLGPLGIRTLMHDQNWARPYPLQEKAFPQVLKDAYGPLMNVLEVLHVQEKGPANNYIQNGDLILEIEGEPLKSALWVNLDNKFTGTKNRGLEIHAGKMIDLAEGRGKIKIKVLRLPKKYKLKPIAKRPEKHIKKFKTKAGKGTELRLYLPQSQYLTIKGNEGSFSFQNMVIENEQGVKVPLHKLDKGNIFKNSFWRKSFIDQKNGHWGVKAPFHFHMVMPPGNWTLSALIVNQQKTSANIDIGYIEKAQIPAELKHFCKTVEFKIPRIGSFGKSFDPNSDKVRNYTAIMAQRLATEQCPDGSWPYIKGYTSPAFYTSMCALGLMAENNPAYNKHIRKAAYYVAYSGAVSNWSWTRGINAMFLAEYYLRSKDKSIVDGLSLALQRCEDCLLVDYVAGHHATSPGDGGFGQISGSGAVACAFAIAEHTPAKFTRGTALKMMATIQSFSPRGMIPYGRRTLGSITK